MSFKIKWLYSNVILIATLQLRLASPEKSVEEKVETFEEACKELETVEGETTEVLREKYYTCLPYITEHVKGSDPYVPSIDSYYLLEPPTDQGKTSIKVTKLEMGSFHVLGESDFHPDIELEIKITWIDSRLKWNQNEWHFNTYPVELKPSTNIWGPKFNQKTTSQVDLLFELFSYYEPVVQYNGNVSATIGGKLIFNKCHLDVSKYPYDTINCCTEFSVNAHDNNAVLDTENVDKRWDTTTGGYWEVMFLNLDAKHEPKNGQPSEGMEMCVGARRNTNVLGMELSLPMGVSAIVMMCAQLAGKWKMQIYVKMFALFLQVFSFQTIIPKEAMSAAVKLPKIYQFYNFTVGITIFSLIQTMLFWALSRRWFIMPPPHKMVLCMKAISRFMLGDSKQSADPDSTAQLDKVAANGHRKEWEVIFLTLHAVLSVLIIIAYVIGVIVIYAS